MIIEFRDEGTKEIVWNSGFPFGASSTQPETPPILRQTVPSSPYIHAGSCQHYANHLCILRRGFIPKDTREESKLYLAEISRGPYLVLTEPAHPPPTFFFNTWHTSSAEESGSEKAETSRKFHCSPASFGLLPSTFHSSLSLRSPKPASLERLTVGKTLVLAQIFLKKVPS